MVVCCLSFIGCHGIFHCAFIEYFIVRSGNLILIDIIFDNLEKRQTCFRGHWKFINETQRACLFGTNCFRMVHLSVEVFLLVNYMHAYLLFKHDESLKRNTQLFGRGYG